MKTVVWIAAASLMGCVSVFSQGVEIPRLPELYVFRYEASSRDPFISPLARRTIVTGGSNLEGVVSLSVVQQYLQTIAAAIRQELFIGGLSTGDEHTRAIAVINGVTFAEGDKIPLPVQPEQLVQLRELARTYGLPLEASQSQQGTIFVAVGAVRANGVSIVLPGFKGALCELPYAGDNIPEKIQLERKHASP
jgi:hypothetical protein